jgi:hypothetical protein
LPSAKIRRHVTRSSVARPPEIAVIMRLLFYCERMATSADLPQGASCWRRIRPARGTFPAILPRASLWYTWPSLNPTMSAIGTKQTCRREFAHVRFRSEADMHGHEASTAQAADDPMYGRPWVARRPSEWRMCGLASMYPAFAWSLLCPGPSWISARLRSH